MPGRHDVGRHSLVVEVEQGLVVDEDVASPQPVLELLDLLEQLAVGREERVVRAPLALHQRVPDEQLPRDLGVDAAIGDAPGHHERHAVERDLLVGQHGALLARPVRLAVGPLEQMCGQRLDPLRLDAPEVATPEP